MGVTWKSNLGDLQVALYHVGLCLHVLGLALLATCFWACYRNLRKTATGFWWGSLLATVLVVLCTATELLYILYRQSSATILPWNSFGTMAGDVGVRGGYITLSALRLYRLELVVSKEATRRVRLGVLITVVAMVASLCCAISLRYYEFIYVGVSPQPAVLVLVRDTERIVSFLAFLIVGAGNVATDMLFARTVITTVSDVRRSSTMLSASSLGLNRKRDTLLVYVPAVLVYLAYFAALIAAISLNSIPGLPFSTITLQRFSTTIALSTFLLYSVPQTRKLIARTRVRDASTSQQANTGASNTVPNTVTSSSTSVNRVSPLSSSKGEKGKKMTIGVELDQRITKSAEISSIDS
ncbi:hypothetical protein H9P43_002610 [Blastocladiella emersonii ATCC 22665]|nr:hypothetical protein H9P43_002610 [Blastocladiella emersonii ATCC 22665]